MHITIVGSTSVIGAAIGRHLGDRGAKVESVGRRQAEAVIDLQQPPSLPIRRRSGDAWRTDVVINVAATVGLTSHDDAAAYAVNVEGAEFVVRFAAAAGAGHLIHMSSIYAVQGDRYAGPPVYAATKAAGERRVAAAAEEEGLALAIVRPTHVYDAEGRCRRYQELPYRFAELAVRGDDIEVHGAGAARRDYLHLADLVRAVGLVVDRTVIGTISIASPSMPTIREIADSALAAFGAGGRVLLLPDRPEPPSMAPVDNAGWARLGTHPEIDILAGFRRMREAMTA